MLRSQNHIRSTEERIGAGGENAQISGTSANAKSTSAPMERPIQFFCISSVLVGHSTWTQIFQQPLRVGGDFQNPLSHRFADDIRSTDFALPSTISSLANTVPNAGHQLTGTSAIGQPALRTAGENPLRPPVVILIGGAELAIPIVGESPTRFICRLKVAIFCAW